MKIVIDTNILVAALKSKRGASYKLLSILPNEKLSTVVSVPLITEYEDVLGRVALPDSITENDIADVVDYICAISKHQDIYFLWCPFLADPSDDHVLETAVAGGCDIIVTYNKRDFRGVDQFGLWVLDARELLIEIGEL